jgi:hypothetical protein
MARFLDGEHAVLMSNKCHVGGCRCKTYAPPPGILADRTVNRVELMDVVSAYPQTAAKTDDLINHPAHYTDGEIEVWDYIDDKSLGYFKGNAVKYISRAGKKSHDTEIQDLEKAIAYLNREIERIKKNIVRENTKAFEEFRNPGQTPLDYAGHHSIQGDN